MDNVIGLLPVLRFPWRRRKPIPALVAVAEPLPPVPATPEPALWAHRPPEAFQRANECGQCGNRVPEASVDGEFCSTLCAAAWLTASQRPVYTCEPPPMIGPRPADEPVPAEPPWMARLTAWERKRAEVVMEPRKVPQATREAA